MRKNRMVISFIPLMSLAFIVSCNKNGKLPAISSFKEKTPDVYKSTTYGAKSLVKLEELSGKYKVYSINDNSIPYVSVKDAVDNYFLNQQKILYPNIFLGYTYETKDNVTTITNEANKEATCVIDYKKQTMEFKDYIAFLNNDKDQTCPIDLSLSGGRNYLLDIKKEEYVAPNSSLIIDFTKYSIPLFCKDNEGYLPLEVVNNLIVTLPSVCITYVDNKNQVIINTEQENFITSNQIEVNKLIGAEFSSDYMKYCYNLNALTLDINFGLQERKSRSKEGTTIKYSNKTAYDRMKEYDFTSSKPNEVTKSFTNLINRGYDDGGHTSYSGVSFIDDKTPEYINGDELEHTAKVHSVLTVERNNKNLSPYDITKDINAIGYFKIMDGEKSDTAFLTMDRFLCKPGVTQYYLDTISLVKYVNEQLRTEDGKKVKNLVLDLSLNVGGTVFTECFMSGWLTRGNSHAKTYNYLTGAYGDVSYKPDLNGDSKFDDFDKLPSTVEHLYVITSPSSFSCGNLLSCDLKDYASTYTNFIGERTGGGGCMVRGGLLSGYGSSYSCSSGLAIGRSSSTKDNFICNDDGVGPDEKITKDKKINSLSEFGKFYDRDEIYNFIHKS